MWLNFIDELCNGPLLNQQVVFSCHTPSVDLRFVCIAINGGNGRGGKGKG